MGFPAEMAEPEGDELDVSIPNRDLWVFRR